MFDRMYAATDDPWGYQVRWYEERKRALLLAALSKRSYENVLELGCGNGETSLALAPRCQQLLALDGSQRAVTLAARKLAGHPHAEARQVLLPDAWPEGQFDLVVVSEMAYYLEASELEAMLQLLSGALREGAEVVFCHWRHAIAGCDMNGDQVHARTRQWSEQEGLRLMSRHEEPDFLLDVYLDDHRSIAQREGLV
jgi:SAM-dependent methyltransferase